MVPILETARLRLRGCRFEDIDAHAAALADPQVMRFIGGQPCSREDAWRRMLIAPGMWSLIGYGIWVESSPQRRLGFQDEIALCWS